MYGTFPGCDKEEEDDDDDDDAANGVVGHHHMGGLNGNGGRFLIFNHTLYGVFWLNWVTYYDYFMVECDRGLILIY